MKKMDQEKYQSGMDKIGIAVSVACLAHCVVMPLVLTSLTMAGIEVLSNVWLEALMIVIALAAGITAISKGFKKHGKRITIWYFLAGILLLISGNLFVPEFWEIVLKGFGALLLITAHTLNYRLVKIRG